LTNQKRKTPSKGKRQSQELAANNKENEVKCKKKRIKKEKITDGGYAHDKEQKKSRRPSLSVTSFKKWGGMYRDEGHQKGRGKVTIFFPTYKRAENGETGKKKREKISTQQEVESNDPLKKRRGETGKQKKKRR